MVNESLFTLMCAGRDRQPVWVADGLLRLPAVPCSCCRSGASSSAWRWAQIRSRRCLVPVSWPPSPAGWWGSWSARSLPCYPTCSTCLPWRWSPGRWATWLRAVDPVWPGHVPGFLVWIIAMIVAVVVIFVTFRFNLQKWVIIIATSILGTAVVFGTFILLFYPAANFLENPGQGSPCRLLRC